MPDEVAEGVQSLVDGGASPSFSAFVAAATKAQLDRDSALAAFRAHTGGPPSDELRADAERLFGIQPAAAPPLAPSSDRKAS